MLLVDAPFGSLEFIPNTDTLALLWKADLLLKGRLSQKNLPLSSPLASSRSTSPNPMTFSAISRSLLNRLETSSDGYVRSRANVKGLGKHERQGSKARAFDNAMHANAPQVIIASHKQMR